MKKRLSSRFKKALLYAFKLHRKQRRKASEVPYFAHLMGVSAIVLENGGSEKQAIAALLHDSVEDQGGRKTLKKIKKRFGKTVARIVEGCSDSETKPKPPWLERKLKYLDELKEEDEEILLVSLADKYYNATTIWWDLQNSDQVWERFNASKEDILWYYTRLDQTFQERFPGTLASEFHLVVERILNYAAPYIPYEELFHRHELPGDEQSGQTVEQPVIEEKK